MAWGALIYGYAANAEDITQMPRVDFYKDSHGRMITVDNEEVYPIEWAVEHHRYGDYVHPEDMELWYSNKVVFGMFLGETGDELSIENMEEAKIHASEIAEAVKFFTGWDTDISDYSYHVCTIYD